MTPPPPPPDTRPLLVAADWQSRALLLAELAERGVETRAEAGVQWAVRALLHERLAPPLLLLDTRDDTHATPEKLARLLRLLDSAPTLLLLVGTFERGLWQEALGERATILVRPKTVGEVARAVQAALE